MLLSRQNNEKKSKNENKISSDLYSLDYLDYIQKTDFTGALSVINFLLKKKGPNSELYLWKAYCHAHLNDYLSALKVYEKDYKFFLKNFKKNSKLKNLEEHKKVNCLMSVCMFMLGNYEESANLANSSLTYEKEIVSRNNSKGKKIPKNPDEVKYQELDPMKMLAVRVLFHAAHKLDQEEKVLNYHSKLEDTLENQLSLGSIHFMRSHYTEAIQLYKNLFDSNQKCVAIYVYLALCYYKLEEYELRGGF